MFPNCLKNTHQKVTELATLVDTNHKHRKFKASDWILEMTYTLSPRGLGGQLGIFSKAYDSCLSG